MSEIRVVSLEDIDENPHRQLATYPTIEKKVETLKRSFQDVGVWEGIIARRVADRFQIAFGHHRFEAAKRLGLAEIPLIVRELSDEQMLKFMGRENGEDYATEFLVMLNTWEGAVKFGHHGGQKTQVIDTARLLGWVRPRGQAGRQREDMMSPVAEACASAYALISGGYIERDQLQGLSVKAAREIMQRAHHRMDQIEKAAQVNKRPPQEKEKSKKHFAKAAVITAEKAAKGEIAQRDLGAEVDVNAFKSATTTKVKDSPLFAVFGDAVVKSLSRMLDQDAMAEKLGEIADVVNKVTMEEDHAVLRRLDFQLNEVRNRADLWRKRLTPTAKKVVGLPQIENRGGKDNG